MSSEAGAYRGRFAPSPTGPLHAGSLLAAVASFLDARSRGGQWLVRVEDLDPPREVPGAADDILRTLEAFALHWDGGVIFQSSRTSAYEAALATLSEKGLVFPCTCSRRDIAETNAARGLTGSRVYPGTCRSGAVRRRRRPVLRMLTSPGAVAFTDRLQGSICQDLEAEVGDFILKRRDGLFAYQLAVVVDDAWQGITDVVRGVDLLDSTPRQISLQRALGLPTPRYMHFPVIVSSGGEKLSKQTGAAPVEARHRDLVAWEMLHLLGQSPPPGLKGAHPAELWQWALSRWRPQQMAGRRALPEG